MEIEIEQLQNEMCALKKAHLKIIEQPKQHSSSSSPLGVLQFHLDSNEMVYKDLVNILTFFFLYSELGQEVFQIGYPEVIYP